MKPLLTWTSAVLAAAAVCAALFPLPQLAAGLAGISLLLAFADAWRTKTLGFVWLFFAAAPFVATHAEAPLGLAALALGVTGRLLLYRRNEEGVGRNRAFAAELRALLPAEALVFIDTDIEGKVPAASLREGHLVRVQAGDRLPSDGQITFGSGVLEETALDGSKEPAAKGLGSHVFGGTLVRNGSFLFRVALAPEQCFASRLAQQLEGGTLSYGLRALTLDCLTLALVGAAYRYGFASPLNLLLATGAGNVAFASYGLQQSFRARSAALGFHWGAGSRGGREAGLVVASDAGLLTEGRLRLTEIHETEGTSEDAAILLAAPLARRLETPAAFALLQERQRRNIPLETLEDYQAIPGGARALVGGVEVSWVNHQGQENPGVLASFRDEAVRNGAEVSLLFRDQKPAAAFSFRDRPLPDASRAVRELQALNLPLVLIARDLTPGQALARELGVQHVQAPASQGELTLLLERFVREGLRPLAFANLPWPLPQVKGVAVAAPAWAASTYPEALCLLRESAAAAVSALGLARRQRRSENTFFALALGASALLAFVPVHPVAASLIGLLPGLYGTWRAAAFSDFHL